jgi:hypothetical protein
VTDARTAFLTVASATSQLLRGDVLPSHWDEPSALPDMTTGALAAHLGRAVLTAHAYLTSPAPPADAEQVDAAGYYLRVLGDAPQDDALHLAVRRRAAEGAAGGAAALAAEVDRALHELRTLLPTTPADRLVGARDGLALLVDDYLDTRVVELVVHLDDLGVSIGDDLAIDDDAAARAVAVLAEIARRRLSTAAVVRQLARRERAPGGVHAL